ncbi:MAG: hypothetical protein GX190_04645 [Mollicutes bacterium]|nr:hypothetical protein [Mollicutes bacterium]
MKQLKALIVLLLVVLLVGCNQSFNWQETEDSLNFNEEYEALNGEKNANGNEYVTVEIPSTNPFKYLTTEETVKFLEEGTGVIYFGMPTCPYCRSTLETLLEFAKKNKIETIYYFNPQKIREENTPEYQRMVEILEYFLPTDKVTQKEDDPDFNPNKKRLLVPDVYFVNKGEVISHYSAVEYKTKLTEEQLKSEIKKYESAYEDFIGAQSTCDEDC